MSLISLIITVAILGFLCWLVLQIPLPQPFRNIIIGIIILFMVLWVLQQFGFLGDIGHLRLK